jgi:6-phosphogluconolactonase
MRMDTRVFPDLELLSRAVMDEMMPIVREAVKQQGRFSVALSGGHTPAKMYELWAAKPYRDDTPWNKVHLFWGDERYVPHDDPRSNFRMAREALISHVPIPPENVHAIPTVSSRPAKSAEDYEKELREFFGARPPAIDVQLMGLGTEGHTASLFPGSPALEEKKRWVLAVEAPVTPPQRLTLTPMVLDRGLHTFFLISGEEKRQILAALRAEPDGKSSQYPAARLSPDGPVVWFLDRAAAG